MRLNGLGVSPGIGVGRALVVTRGSGNLRFRIADRRVPLELERLDAARARSRTQLEHIKKRIATAAGTDHAYLFDAQLLMLDDPMLVERAASLIQTDRLNAESALDRALDEVSALFDRGDDPYLRERKGDVADVVGRLCMNLQPNGDPGDLFRDIDGPLVLVADELSPSLIAQMDWQRLAALVTDAGSWTYHTAILARSLHVPAVAGLRHASKLIPPGALLAVDGSSGDVTLEPSPDLLEELDVRSRKRRAYEESIEEYGGLPSIMQDGTAIRIEANVELPEEAERARERGAEGIGLYRSEFLLAGASATGLDEDAQYAMYVRLIDAMRGRRVTVRTFDVTEGQLGLGASGDAARAPLGLRGLRLSLSFDDIFQAQLRALLRAAIHGPLRIMFPFVTGVEELRAARAAIVQARGHAAEARHRRADRAGRRHDRGALGGADGRSPLCRSRFLQRRHERPDSILPGGRSHRRSRVGDVRATASRDSAHAAPRRARCAAPGRARRRLRGDGRGVLAAAAADGARIARVQHGTCGDPAGEAGGPQPASCRYRTPRQPGAARGHDRRCRTNACGILGARQMTEETTVDHVDKVEKPWGYELHWAKTARYVGKLIHVNAGHALSLQYHNQKDETIFLWSGQLLFEIGDEKNLTKREMAPGDAVHITPGTVHRMTAISDCDIFEVSTPELHDVVRLEDRYGRT